MQFTAATHAQAQALAAQLRALYKGLDWVITVYRPLFPGDLYRVTVGV